MTYTFRLRDGLEFHDEQPVRAADAVASLKRWGQRNHAYGQGAARRSKAIDDKQARIVLKQRFPVLEALGTMTSPTPFILPERLAETDAFTQITEGDGPGPFKSPRRSGSRATMPFLSKTRTTLRAPRRRKTPPGARWSRSTVSNGSIFRKQ